MHHKEVSVLYLWSYREPACRTRSRRCYRRGCGTLPGSCSGAGSWQWGLSCCRRLLGRSALVRGSHGCCWLAHWLWFLLHWGHLSLEPPCYWWSGEGRKKGYTSKGTTQRKGRKRQRDVAIINNIFLLSSCNTVCVVSLTRLWWFSKMLFWKIILKVSMKRRESSCAPYSLCCLQDAQLDSLWNNETFQH